MEVLALAQAWASGVHEFWSAESARGAAFMEARKQLQRACCMPVVTCCSKAGSPERPLNCLVSHICQLQIGVLVRNHVHGLAYEFVPAECAIK